MLSIIFTNQPVRESLCQIGYVGAPFKTSFTDGLCGVHEVALPVRNASKIMPYFALCVCFVNKPWTVGEHTTPHYITSVLKSLH